VRGQNISEMQGNVLQLWNTDVNTEPAERQGLVKLAEIFLPSTVKVNWNREE
jgi:hypothetical protein